MQYTESGEYYIEYARVPKTILDGAQQRHRGCPQHFATLYFQFLKNVPHDSLIEQSGIRYRRRVSQHLRFYYFRQSVEELGQ